MKRIFKYPLTVKELAIPVTWTPLRFALQRGVPTLWAEVSTWEPSLLYIPLILGTGQIVPEDAIHLGSLEDDGGYIWHYFLIRKEDTSSSSGQETPPTSQA